MPSSKAHIIVIDGPHGSGRKTFCLELSLALLYCGQKTAVMLSPDSPLRQTLQKRQNIIPAQPIPSILNRQNFHQQADNFDAVIIPEITTHNELAAMAGTFITMLPKNTAFARGFPKNTTYINGLWELKKKIAAIHNRSLNWVVCENNLSGKFQDIPSKELSVVARMYGFRTTPPLNFRKAYQNNAEGVSAQDKSTPELKNKLTYEDICAKREILKLAEFIFS